MEKTKNKNGEFTKRGLAGELGYSEETKKERREKEGTAAQEGLIGEFVSRTKQKRKRLTIEYK